jgi:hypothetical protein
MFVDVDVAKGWVVTGQVPIGDYWQQGIRRWAVEGTILFERDNLLSDLRALSAPLPWFTSPTAAQLYAIWFSGYYRLKQLGRHLQTDEKSTLLYLDLRLGFFIHQAVQFYFAVRDHPWSGTRRALVSLAERDQQFFRLVEGCVHESDRALKWSRCVRLFDEVVRPIGGWPDEATGVAFTRGATITDEVVKHAMFLIKELFEAAGPRTDTGAQL